MVIRQRFQNQFQSLPVIGMRIALVLGLVSGIGNAAYAADRYDLAARITYSIAKFSTWPEGVEQDGAFLVGVFGGNSARAFSAVDGGKLKTGQIRVVNLDSSSPAGEIRKCAIVFTTETADLKRVTKATTGSPVMLVHLGMDRDAGANACVSLFEASNRMQFDVYLALLRKRNVQMDSGVLKLAATVYRR
tara:strand:+ start:5506 stop:6075 length:570 start_codon:yes stop_codon:yes gene_type:complete